MPRTLDFESDQLLRLLTDALRAGPGSPQWHEAVQRLHGGGEQADEYRLLCEARQRLESGLEYRAVRPGPGFTRKVLESIERAPQAAQRGVPTARLILILSAAVLLIVIAGLAYVVISAGADGGGDLTEVYFVNTALETRFEGELGRGWRAIGMLPLETSGRGLRPAAWPAAGDEPWGGGLVWRDPIPAEQPIALEVTLRMPRLSEEVIPQVFVSERPTFSDDRATSACELVWMVQGGRQRMALGNSRLETSQHTLSASRQPVMVRLRLDRRRAIVDAAGERIWAGEHHLSPDAPRYFGVRFLHRGEESAEITIESVRLMTP